MTGGSQVQIQGQESVLHLCPLLRYVTEISRIERAPSRNVMYSLWVVLNAKCDAETDISAGPILLVSSCVCLKLSLIFWPFLESKEKESLCAMVARDERVNLWI